jgi:hypothetical protein
MKIRNAWFTLTAIICGCFYPPQQKPLPESATEVKLAIPYDLAWDAVQTVAATNNLKVIANDPNNGILETQAPTNFTLAAADCGDLKGIIGKYKAEPEVDASAVYNFEVKPHGGEASVVRLQATFTAPLRIPMHPVSDVQCVSRGIEESRLLKEVAEQASKEHRPTFAPEPSNGPSLLPQDTGDTGEINRGGIEK